jgi:hypothetical protein
MLTEYYFKVEQNNSYTILIDKRSVDAGSSVETNLNVNACIDGESSQGYIEKISDQTKKL